MESVLSANGFGQKKNQMQIVRSVLLLQSVFLFFESACIPLICLGQMVFFCCPCCYCLQKDRKYIIPTNKLLLGPAFGGKVMSFNCGFSCCYCCSPMTEKLPEFCCICWTVQGKVWKHGGCGYFVLFFQNSSKQASSLF